MTETAKDEAREFIQQSIAFGFESNDMIFDNTLEILSETDGEIDEGWVEKEIQNQAHKRLAQSKTWPQYTDFHKLAIAFDRLCRQSIIALHFGGFTRQDCEGLAQHTYEQLMQQGLKAQGFCYYHEQDVARAIDPDTTKLLIGFGEFDGGEAQALFVGNLVATELKAVGFTLDWDGNIQHRITILNFEWCKLPDDQDWSEGRVLALFPKNKAGHAPKEKPWWRFW